VAEKIKRKPLAPDDPEQSKRFKEAARELETDGAGEAFDRVFRKVMAPQQGASTDRTKKCR